jgi:phosphoglycolate phosphatase-like HAD superfamily hydrolase
MRGKLSFEILIFDVDGVLVDVRGTYWRSALQTVRHITGKRVTYAELRVGKFAGASHFLRGGAGGV